jgi:hypothetical protein
VQGRIDQKRDGDDTEQIGHEVRNSHSSVIQEPV